MDSRLELDIYQTHGLGRHLIVFRSEYQHIPEPVLQKYLQNNWHVHYISIDLHESEDIISRKLANTLNHLHYVKNFVFDYVSFLLFLKNIERIQVAYDALGIILIFDPVRIRTLKKSFFSRKKRNVTRGLLGENLALPVYLNEDLLIKTSHFKPVSARIVGFSDPAYALKLSSLIKNSLFDYSKNIDQLYSLIQKHFS